MADTVRLSAAILLAADTLPAVPVDALGLGRHVSWVELAKAPGFHYGAQFIDVDAAWIQARIELHSVMLARGFYPPVLIAHEDTGERAGDVVALGSAMIDGRLTLLGALAWNDADAASKISARVMTDVSVGLYPLQNPDTGEVLEMAVGETSLTTLPHLLGDSRILNAQNGGQPMDMPEISADDRLLALEEMVTQLVTMVGELAGEGADSVEAASDVSTVVSEVTAMGVDDEEEILPVAASVNPADAVLLSRLADVEAQLADAQEKEARAVYANGLPLGAKIELTQAVADMLYPLWRSDVKALDIIKASLVKPDAAPVASAPVIRMTSAWDAIGVADDSAEPAKYDMAAAMAEARITAKANGTRVSDEYKINLARVQE
jgi:hypothetical protein